MNRNRAPMSEEEYNKCRDIISGCRCKNPYLSNTKLAQLVLKENKHIHLTTETLRKAMTYFKNKELKKEKISLDLALTNQEIEIIQSQYKARPFYIIPSSVDNLLVFADVHIPYHDMIALKMCLMYGLERHINGILINGDLSDFYGISRFNKRPDQTNVFFEIERTRMFLEQLRKLFPNIPIYYKFGNHEERWEQFIWKQIPEMSADPELYLESRLKLANYHIEVIKDKRIIQFGMLNIIHGHEIFASSGAVNLSRNFLLKTFENILFCHFHRTQEYMKPTITNKNLGSFAIGCLCGISPDYAPINDWNHGFAIVQRDQNGYFKVDNKMIINGQII
jgi:hypothetical protein